MQLEEKRSIFRDKTINRIIKKWPVSFTGLLRWLLIKTISKFPQTPTTQQFMWVKDSADFFIKYNVGIQCLEYVTSKKIMLEVTGIIKDDQIWR